MFENDYTDSEEATRRMLLDEDIEDFGDSDEEQKKQEEEEEKKTSSGIDFATASNKSQSIGSKIQEQSYTIDITVE